MEQEKINVARATPVPESPAGAVRRRRGAPMWLQILLSLLVIAIAAGVAGTLLPSANAALAQVGIRLPLLSGAADTAAPVPTPSRPTATQAQQGGTAQRQGGPAAGQGGARSGGFGGRGAATVVAVAAGTGTINNKLTSIGEGVAANSVTVNTASGGTLSSVDVRPGDHVLAGARLATLDSDTQQNALDKANLALRDADATLARTRQLAKSNAVATSQVDAAQLADDNARLALQAAQIALTQRTITTPIAGTVGLIQVSPGNLINAQTIVTTIEDASDILVNFWVPERYSSQIATGMRIDATSSALPGRSFVGTVTAVDNRIDSDSRTLQIQATIPNPDGVIRPGMSFSVDMKFPGENFPSVDPLSVQWSNDGAYVWKVVDGKAVKAMLDIIQRNSDGVLVKGDVSPGDLIVTQGVLQLSDGAAVQLLGAGAGGASDASTPPQGEARSAPAGQSGRRGPSDAASSPSVAAASGG